MSQIVETCTRGCQISSLSNTQEHLNIFVFEVLLKMNKAKNQSFSGYEGRFSGEGLTDDGWTNRLLHEEPTGRLLTAKVHVFSDSVRCTVQAQEM